jgi:hypothetical protein
LLGSFFDPEDRSEMCLGNIGGFAENYISQQTELFMTSALRTSIPKSF